MSEITVVYDACVLYPAPLRSFLMYLALTGLYRARWTNAIHEEWIRSATRDYANFTREQAEAIRNLMDLHVMDCLVSGYEPLISTLSLPDPDDRHVLAAAIHCKADVIVTSNLRDFPAQVLEPYGLKAQHPDAFIVALMDISPEMVCLAARQQRQGLKNPPLSVDDYLASLARQALPQTVARLREHATIF